MRRSARKRTRGGAALEMAMLMPWYVFLFVGAYDWGNYAHALISTEAAARAAVIYTSQDGGHAADATTACAIVRNELSFVSNDDTSTGTCTALPIIVTATLKTGANSADGSDASEVAVTYRTINLIPIPGVLKGQATFYRVVQMRIRG